jgi:hypothetical protein
LFSHTSTKMGRDTFLVTTTPLSFATLCAGISR